MSKTDAEAGMGWTPGPWFAEADEDEQWRVYAGVLPGMQRAVYEIADVWRVDKGSREANARLIAAAPELASLAAGVDDLLPLVSEWFAASPEERAKEGPDWEARAHMAVLALVSTARAALDSCKRRET